MCDALRHICLNERVKRCLLNKSWCQPKAVEVEVDIEFISSRSSFVYPVRASDWLCISGWLIDLIRSTGPVTSGNYILFDENMCSYKITGTPIVFLMK